MPSKAYERVYAPGNICLVVSRFLTYCSTFIYFLIRRVVEVHLINEKLTTKEHLSLDGEQNLC
jgi:hypothetical protein